MIEAMVAVAIAAATGLAISVRRIDAIELKMAERYCTREEVRIGMKACEEHLLRIENKLDSLTTLK